MVGFWLELLLEVLRVSKTSPGVPRTFPGVPRYFPGCSQVFPRVLPETPPGVTRDSPGCYQRLPRVLSETPLERLNKPKTVLLPNPFIMEHDDTMFYGERKQEQLIYYKNIMLYIIYYVLYIIYCILYYYKNVFVTFRHKHTRYKCTIQLS